MTPAFSSAVKKMILRPKRVERDELIWLSSQRWQKLLDCFEISQISQCFLVETLFLGDECLYFHGQRYFALYQVFLPWRRVTWCIQCLWMKSIKFRRFLSLLLLSLSIPFLFFEKNNNKSPTTAVWRLLVQAGLWLAPMLAGLATQLFNVRTKHGEGALHDTPWLNARV